MVDKSILSQKFTTLRREIVYLRDNLNDINKEKENWFEKKDIDKIISCIL